MEEKGNLSRRAFLTGRRSQTCIQASGEAVFDRPGAHVSHHISSAVVSVLPHCAQDVLGKLEAMENVEIYAAEGSKIVLVIEGPDTGVLGDRLTQIALLDGVITANMVYEHIENMEVAGHEHASDAA